MPTRSQVSLPDYALDEIRTSLQQTYPSLELIACTRNETAQTGSVTFTLAGAQHSANFSLHPNHPQGPIPYLRAVQQAVAKRIAEVEKRKPGRQSL